ncbi:MAG: calcium/sodium antiporter [Blautia sp.]|jgi:cation:H+ antiporter
MWTYFMLFAGFFLLIKGADLFVSSSSSIAKKLRIPSVIIGLTIVALGTSLPEASVSITAALTGKNELSVSNVIGSNIFNLMVVIGISAMLHPIPVKSAILRRDFPVSIGITVLLMLMYLPMIFQEGHKTSVLTRPEGLLLLILAIGYLTWVTRDALSIRQQNQGSAEEPELSSPVQIFFYLILGVGGIIFGGEWVVDSASAIGTSFGMSETLVGLTIVALGTSLPELATSVVAARKGECDLALGNALGSNILNILLVLGSSSALHPVTITLYTVYDTAILIAFSIVAFLFARSGHNFRRREGLMLCLLYLLFFLFIIVR